MDLVSHHVWNPPFVIFSPQYNKLCRNKVSLGKYKSRGWVSTTFHVAHALITVFFNIIMELTLDWSPLTLNFILSWCQSVWFHTCLESEHCNTLILTFIIFSTKYCLFDDQVFLPYEDNLSGVFSDLAIRSVSSLDWQMPKH